jgi:hypothetical protein
VQNAVDLLVEVKAPSDVVADEFEAGVVGQVFDVGQTPCDEIVDTKYAVAFVQETITEVGSQESRTAGDHYGGSIQ